MRIFWRTLVGVVVLLVVLVAGVLIYVSRMDPARYNDYLVEAVRDATGRELDFAGSLRVKLFPQIAVEASEVTFSNAPWAAEKDMVRVESVRAELAWLPLLGGDFQVRDIVVIAPRIFLETDANGRGNWELERPGERPADTPASSAGPSGLDVEVTGLRVEKASIRYRDGASGRSTVVRVEELALASAGGRDLTVRLRGAYQDLDADIAGTVKTPASVLGDERIAVDLSGTVGGADIGVAGTIDRPARAQGLNLAIAVEAPASKPFTDVAGIDFENLGPIALKARLTDPERIYRLDDIDLAARGLGAEVAATGSIANLVSGPAPDLQIAFKAESTEQLTRLAGLELEAMGPVTLDAKLVGDGGHLHLEGVKLAAQGLGADVRAEGAVRELGATPKPALELHLSAASTKRLTELAELDVRDLGPVEFRGRLVDNEGRLDLDPFELTARPPDVDLQLKGSVASLRDKPRPDVKLSAKAKSLRHLAETLPAAGPVDVSARVEPRGRIIEVTELAAKVGESDLGGTFKVNVGGERPGVTGQLRARTLNLDELAGEAPPPNKEAAPSPGGKKRVFPDDPIPLEALGAVDADVQLSAGRVIRRGLAIEDVSISLSLKDRRLGVKPAMKVAGGRVEGVIDLEGAASPAELDVRLGGTAVGLGALSEAFRDKGLVKGAPMDFEVDVKGKGESLRAIMARLDGRIRVNIGRGELLGERINIAGGDLFSQLLGGVIPRGDEDKSILECAVAHFEIRDGFAVADQSLVLETNKVLVKGGGAIDLASEEVGVGARMGARTGLRLGAGSLGSVMKVGGTLAEPRLAVDLKGAMETGVRITGAVFTMGLSLVAENLYGELQGDPHPCETARTREFEPYRRGEGDIFSALPGSEAVKKGTRAVTDTTGAVVKGTAEESGKLIEKIGSGIKKLLE